MMVWEQWLGTHHDWRVLTAEIGMALASAWLCQLVVRQRALGRALSSLRTLPPASLPGGQREGEPARLQGLLRVEGEPCPRLDGGAPCAASTAWKLPRGTSWDAPDEHRRAGRLSVDINGERVPLHGQVEVLVGSTESHLGLLPSWLVSASRERLRRMIGPAGGRLPAFGPVYRSLADGDRVYVAGFWAAHDEPAADAYRGDGARLAVVPPSEARGQGRPVIQLAYLGAPRIRGPHLALRAVIALLAAALTFSGWYVAYSWNMSTCDLPTLRGGYLREPVY